MSLGAAAGAPRPPPDRARRLRDPPRVALLLAAFVCAPAAPASAQRLQGRVVSAADSAPVPAALVALLDANGAQVVRTSTGPAGGFTLEVPSAGRYVVEVLRIGQRPWRSPALELGPPVPRRLVIAVPDDPVVLEPVAIRARTRCRTSPAEGSLVATLLAEADKALTLTRLAMESGEVGYAVERYHVTRSPRLETRDSSAIIDPLPAWPIRSWPAESLAVHGFVREEAPTFTEPYGGYSFFGPDAPLLLSAWFLSTHCFGASAGSGPDSGAILVTFRPEGGWRADIEGRLVIDRGTLALRRIEWRFVRLPWKVPENHAGGAMVLRRLPSGVYVPESWWQRAPVPEVNRRREPLRLYGWDERGGHIVPGP